VEEALERGVGEVGQVEVGEGSCRAAAVVTDVTWMGYRSGWGHRRWPCRQGVRNRILVVWAARMEEEDFLERDGLGSLWR
jgi:hypothetical protein